MSSSGKREKETHNVDKDGGEDSLGDGLAIRGIVDAADELLVAGAVEHAEDGEDDDCEDGHDGAIGPNNRKQTVSFLCFFFYLSFRKMDE